MYQFFKTTWLCEWFGFDCSIDRQNARESVTKIPIYRSYMYMENIVWHWQSVRNWYDLSKCSFRSHNFHRDARQNLWSHGLFDSKQNGAASNDRRWWYAIFEFMERNTIAREVQTVGVGKNVIYLAYAWYWWGVIGLRHVIEGRETTHLVAERPTCVTK